jgi:hypothetical protein
MSKIDKHAKIFFDGTKSANDITKEIVAQGPRALMYAQFITTLEVISRYGLPDDPVSRDLSEALFDYMRLRASAVFIDEFLKQLNEDKSLKEEFLEEPIKMFSFFCKELHDDCNGKAFRMANMVEMIIENSRERKNKASKGA